MPVSLPTRLPTMPVELFSKSVPPLPPLTMMELLLQIVPPPLRLSVPPLTVVGPVWPLGAVRIERARARHN